MENRENTKKSIQLNHSIKRKYFHVIVITICLFISCADFESQNCQDKFNEFDFNRRMLTLCATDNRGNQTGKDVCLLGLITQTQRLQEITRNCQGFFTRNPSANTKSWKL